MARRVMVVDDNRALARMLGELLSQAGAEARVFDSSPRALEYARAHPIDVALVDLDMPELDGAELLEEVRELSPDARRFLMTGTIEDARISHLAMRGITGVFRKPFSPSRVVDILVPQTLALEAGPGRVAGAMSRDLTSCTPEHDVADAARLMKEHDRGLLVVLDGRSRLAGVITDRDVCMAAYARGRALHEISVASVMSRDPSTCRMDDTLEHAARVMREARVRRLPVLDGGGAVVGVLSLGDLARCGEPTEDLAVRTLRAIVEPRSRVEPRVA